LAPHAGGRRQTGDTTERETRDSLPDRGSFVVPGSQDELRLKIQAIFKHQSRKDSAPFPGTDDREFWQRVDSRNRETAAILDRLGLAEYFAMEAYVVD
jgi:hypothetical protein